MDFKANFKGKQVLITGGSDGIGAASALALQALGARVTIIGRSLSKAQAVAAGAQNEGEAIQLLTADFSRLREVHKIPKQLGPVSIDYLLHCVGTLIPHKRLSDEGLELNFVTSYLSRFYLTDLLLRAGLLSSTARLINVAASSPKIPSMAKVEFQDLESVTARFGMQGHGQAQMANDIWVSELSRRTQLTVIGYGPGSVDTGIRRELPGLMTLIMKPFFALSTRQPEAAAQDLVRIFADPRLKPGQAHYYKRDTSFSPDPFVSEPERARRLWNISEALIARADGFQSLA